MCLMLSNNVANNRQAIFYSTTLTKSFKVGSPHGRASIAKEQLLALARKLAPTPSYCHLLFFQFFLKV